MTVSIHLHSSKLFTDYNKILYNPTYNVVKLQTSPVRAHTHTHTNTHTHTEVYTARTNFHAGQ